MFYPQHVDEPVDNRYLVYSGGDMRFRSVLAALSAGTVALVLALGISPAIVDIDDDPALRERFDTCVPVVEIDGQVRFRGRVEPKLLRRIIRSAG